MTTTKLRPAIDLPTPVATAPVDYLPVRQLVRERLELSGSPDPSDPLAALLDDLAEDLELPADHPVRVAAYKGLHALAGEIKRGERHSVRTGRQRSGRLDAYAEVEKERRDVFEQSICIGYVDGEAQWKFLGDCDKRDLHGAAKLKREFANGVLVVADRYEKLSRQLKRDQVVKDLDRAKVEGILNA